MKTKALFLLAFLLFFSLFYTNTAVMAEETRVGVVTELQSSSDPSFDDLELYAEMIDAPKISLPPILHTKEASALDSLSFDLLEPPESFPFIS